MWKFILAASHFVTKVVRYIHLLRVQLIGLVAMAAFAWYTHSQPILQGLSDAMRPFSLVLITMQAFLLAWSLHLSGRLVLIYGHDRYCIPQLQNARPWLKSPWTTLWVCSIFPAAMLVNVWWQTGNLGIGAKAGAMLLGFLAAFGVLWLVANIHGYIEGAGFVGGRTTEQMYPESLLLACARANGRPPKNLGLPAVPAAWRRPRLCDGIFDLATGTLRSGHRMALLYAGFLFVFYLFYASQGMYYDYNSEKLPAALFFVFMLAMLLTWIFSGLTFFLDRLHVPTITALAVLSFALSWIWPNDHVFPVTVETPKAERTSGELPEKSVKPLCPRKVVADWDAHHAESQKTDPLVIVAAEGGGIEAAAWGTYVLNELEKLTDNKLHEHIILVSSVSGGSAAAYYFLDQYGRPTPNFDLAYRNARASSLGATAWGLAYPDFLRTVPFLGWFIGEHSDRGATMESSWRTLGSRKSLADWLDDTRNGKRPAVLFNATGVESGQPVVFGTTRLSYGLPLFSGENDQRLEQQFFLDFPCSNVEASTAARMSAAFPYVSPESRPDKSTRVPCDGRTTTDTLERRRQHVADGGLFDNSGAVSAVHWIYDLTQPQEDDEDNPCPLKPTDPPMQHPLILVLLTSPYAPGKGNSWTWQHQAAGPLEAMLDIRTGSQHLRRNLETQLLAQLQGPFAPNQETNVAAQDAAKPDDQSKPAAAGEAKASNPAGKPGSLTVLRFCNMTADYLQTLSWHLTRRQEEAIRTTWEQTYSAAGDSAQESQALADALNGKEPQPLGACPCDTVPATGP